MANLPRARLFRHQAQGSIAAMAYDRKPAGYGAREKLPADEANATSTEAAEQSADQAASNADPDELNAERAQQVLAWAAENPQYADLERYDRTAFAGAWLRFLAYLQDVIIVVPTMVIVAWILGVVPGTFDPAAESVGLFGLSPQYAKLARSIFGILVYDLYFAGSVARWGGTWGQKFTGLLVLRRDLNSISKKRARARYAATALSMLPAGLGLVAVLWDRRKRAWHDHLCDTYVVRMAAVPGDLIRARQWQTQDPGETAKDRRVDTNCLMISILLVFAPGLLLVALIRKVLGKLGIIGRREPGAASEESA